MSENQHFQRVPRWCYGCCSEDQIGGTTALRHSSYSQGVAFLKILHSSSLEIRFLPASGYFQNLCSALILPTIILCLVCGVKPCTSLPCVCLVRYLEGPLCRFLRLLCATPSSLLPCAMEDSSLRSNKIESLFSLAGRFAAFFGGSSSLCSSLRRSQAENQSKCGTQLRSYRSFRNYSYMLCFFQSLKRVVSYILSYFVDFYVRKINLIFITLLCPELTVYIPHSCNPLPSNEWKMFSQIASCFSFLPLLIFHSPTPAPIVKDTAQYSILGTQLKGTINEPEVIL